jgi:hypothetical protein
MMSGSAGTLMIVGRTLLVQLDPELTDGAVRTLRDRVGATLGAQALGGVELALGDVPTAVNLDGARSMLRRSTRARSRG